MPPPTFWTARRIARLRVLWDTDKTQDQIAHLLGAHQSMVSYQAIKMQLPARFLRPAYTQRLLSPCRENEFLGRFARGEDLAALIADYGLNRYQLKSLAWRHADRVRMICAAEGLPIPFRRKKPPARKKQPAKNCSRPVIERPEQKKKRHCLRCGEDFLSQWFGNRICPDCGRRPSRSA